MCGSLSPDRRAVFVEVFSFQSFTGYTYMCGDSLETEQVYYIAKVFGAVARAVKALRQEYFFLKPQPRPGFCSPSPTYLPKSPLLGSLEFSERFMYEGRRRDSYRRSLFLAEYQGKTVVVKFCERYGEDARRRGSRTQVALLFKSGRRCIHGGDGPRRRS
jgi:hypothetical protein